MCRPVAPSTVFTSREGPPIENAALILLVPWPGILTCESRGRLSSVGLVSLPGMCATMIVSVRCPPPAASPSPAASRSSAAAGLDGPAGALSRAASVARRRRLGTSCDHPSRSGQTLRGPVIPHVLTPRTCGTQDGLRIGLPAGHLVAELVNLQVARPEPGLR